MKMVPRSAKRKTEYAKTNEKWTLSRDGANWNKARLRGRKHDYDVRNVRIGSDQK